MSSLMSPIFILSYHLLVFLVTKAFYDGIRPQSVDFV